MSETMSRLRLAEEIAGAFERAGIRYAVVHGTHGYPQSIGRDLDLVIAPEGARKAIYVAVDKAAQCGYTKAIARWSHWGLYQLSLIRADEREGLPLDFLCTTGLWRSKWIELMRPDHMMRLVEGDRTIGPFRVSEEGIFIKACIRALLCGDLSRFGHEFPMPVAIPEQVDREWLMGIIGPAGISLLASSSVEELKARYSLWRLQSRWVARHPIGALKSLAQSIVCRIQRAAFDAADVIVVETPRPDAVCQAVEALNPEFKKLFLVPSYFEAPKNGIATRLGLAFGWRKLPISEFRLSVVAKRTNVGQGKMWPGKGRKFLDADCYCAIPDSDAETMRARLRRNLLDFVFDRYGVKSDLPLKCGMEHTAGVRS
jgi:hypothetical protein